jgi:hypothetical protein
MGPRRDFMSSNRDMLLTRQRTQRGKRGGRTAGVQVPVMQTYELSRRNGTLLAPPMERLWSPLRSTG